MDKILDTLNERQKEAVLNIEGAELVLAGAGSGKTRVITHRFAYILREKKLSLHNILAVTFTNKAAGEMKERISSLVGFDASSAWIRTFHSTGVMVIRKNPEAIGYPRDFVIYDDTDSRNLVRSIMKDFGINSQTYNPAGIAEKISSLKDSLASPEEFKKSAISDFDKAAALVYEGYEKVLRKNKAVDFPDLIALPIRIFSENTNILSHYQSLWQYIMADEFQDTNSAQYQLIKLICGKSPNICVVGDDDQSIYGWRGANVDNIYDYKDRYHAKVILLEQNYRSTDVILSAAHCVVEKIEGRMDKKLWTDRKSGEKITLMEALTDKEEAKRIVDKIDALLAHYDYKDFALFYRTNAQSRLLEEELLFHNIPYRVFGGQKFYARKEVKDVLAYVKLIINPFDGASFERIINVPKRKIGEASVEKIQRIAGSKNISFIDLLLKAGDYPELSRAPVPLMTELGQVLLELHQSREKMTPMNFVKVLLDAVGYKNYILNFDEDGLDRWSNVEELINSIKEYENANPDATVIEFINDITLQAGSDELDGDDGRDYVSLMTLHNAKGLEFSVVFISGVTSGLLPHASSYYSPKELNEERRLFYVGLTRAKDRLFLSYPENRLKYGEIETCTPSPFLKDIPDELLVREVLKNYDKYSLPKKGKTASPKMAEDEDDFSGGDICPDSRAVNSISEIAVGDSVCHRRFGVGKVTFASDKFIKVSFEKYGVQTIGGNFLSSIGVIRS